MEKICGEMTKYERYTDVKGTLLFGGGDGREEKYSLIDKTE